MNSTVSTVSHQVSATQGRLIVSRFVSSSATEVGRGGQEKRERLGVGVKAGHPLDSSHSPSCVFKLHTCQTGYSWNSDFIIHTLRFFLLLLPKHMSLPASPKYVSISGMCMIEL